MNDQLRVVFDCNIFLQALARPEGPAGRCVAMAIEGKVTLFISRVILGEIGEVAMRPRLMAKFRFRPERVKLLLDNLPKAAILFPSVPQIWHYERDPDDAHYVNLAIAAGATFIVSRDRDLLDLMNLESPDAVEFRKRFPSLRILDPVRFIELCQDAKR